MSVLTLQYGQCGNQIGYDWYTTLAKDLCMCDEIPVPASRERYVSEGIGRWFNPLNESNEYVARSILVDTEQKVVKDIWKKHLSSQTWRYNSDNVVSLKDGGSGNNWAYGYTNKGSIMLDLIMDSVRKEMEKSDQLLSFLNILGCAGGTGSGVGSYIVEHLKDEYPSKTSINVIVFPYKSGEVITQNYNALLTLAKLYDVSDIHIIFQNDQLHSMCHSLLRCTNICFSDLNSLIAFKLSSVFQPVKWDSGNYISDLVSNLTSHPCYKFVSIKSTPHVSKDSDLCYSWETLMKHIIRTLCTNTSKKQTSLDWESQVPMRCSAPHSLMKYIKCTANVLISRGSGDIGRAKIENLNEPEIYPDWIPVDSRYKYRHENEALLNIDKFMSLVTNNISILEPLNHIVDRAWNQFSRKAYMHQYAKFGVKDDDLSVAFAKVEDVIHKYNELQ